VEKPFPDDKLEDFARTKRNKLFERISIFGTVMGLVHCVMDSIGGSKEAPLIDFMITIVLFTCYVLHRRGYRNTSRILGLSFLNLCLTVYACLIEPEIGIYLFFFPLMAISMGIFGPNERFMRLFFVMLSGACAVALFVSDFDLIGPYQIEAPNTEIFFMINLVSSGVMLVMSLAFILGVNEESERRLKILAEEIKSKNIDLEKTNAELDRFFYSTSHDLRAPLLSIKGLVNIARNETTDRKIVRYFDMMTERANRLDLFIKDIIDYSKNTRTEVSKENVNVIQLVEDVKDNFQFLEGAESIRFQNEIFVESAITDKTRLTVILNNLVSNAIKYHNRDNSDQWIKIGMHARGGELKIVVSDNGSGISEEKQTKIFDMFYRGTEQSKGSGLGLYIVKETIEKMHGAIRVESMEGEGTSFIVTLPVFATRIAGALLTTA